MAYKRPKNPYTHRCGSLAKSGEPCKVFVKLGETYCRQHSKEPSIVAAEMTALAARRREVKAERVENKSQAKVESHVNMNTEAALPSATEPEVDQLDEIAEILARSMGLTSGQARERLLALLEAPVDPWVLMHAGAPSIY